MPKISEEKLKKYRELADIPSPEMQDSALCAIHQRMEEGAIVRDMRDPRVGTYMAPFKKDLDIVLETDGAVVSI